MTLCESRFRLFKGFRDVVRSLSFVRPSSSKCSSFPVKIYTEWGFGCPIWVPTFQNMSRPLDSDFIPEVSMAWSPVGDLCIPTKQADFDLLPSPLIYCPIRAFPSEIVRIWRELSNGLVCSSCSTSLEYIVMILGALARRPKCWVEFQVL